MSALGELEQLVLLAVLRLGSDAYGVAIRDEIASRTGRGVTLGAIYKSLERCQSKRYVESSLGAPLPIRGGRSRRYYRVTAHGRDAVARSLRAIRTMLDGLQPDGLEPIP